MIDKYVIGLDFGTDSVRAIIADTSNGEIVASALAEYTRWKKGMYCNPSKQQYRHHPLDYLESLQQAINECTHKANRTVVDNIVGISVATTGSTPIVVDRTGSPLSMIQGLGDEPDMQFVLWKDHSAVEEASEINKHAAKHKENYLQYVGGIYSSEWFWAKWLHLLRHSPVVEKIGYTMVELCDWLPFILCGGTDANAIKRGVCAAGHKALWSEQWNGFPPDEFFTSLDPLLAGKVSTLDSKTYTAEQSAGTITENWSRRLGVPAAVKIGIGAFDAHMGAVGGEIEPYFMSKVIGTSTCDIMVVPDSSGQIKTVSGICGQVNGSVIPGMVGLEAGQSAFGDAFAWFSKLVNVPIETLSQEAAKLPLNVHDEIANDWLNGRRTPDANQELRGAFMQLHLGSTPSTMFKAIVESACFGAKAIVECFASQQVPVNGVLALGGIAKKSPYVMQVMADVLGTSIKVHQSEQTCAMGAAMFAATAAGVYPDVTTAMKAMGQGFDKTYHPDKTTSSHYQVRYNKYKKLGKFIETSTYSE